ncbi:chorismate mutase [Mycobacterium sp. 1274761.0]|uniref:chorismate mutase n=1 Tax=Mycobacterium sp. 1274761.0 TaxID=1834077 RepID=UPI0008013BBB|nr:chorismate mutase [Mycobacterium sp. 1274761.0]OBK74881.1 chorismate mutase [Mycobacterium sp. 1274761.0]
MTRNRRAVLLLTGLLIGPLPGVASAEPAGPLYRLVDTAAQRLATADPVAASKWIDGGPITDAQRADQVLNAAADDATAHGVDPGYVRAVFTDQIHATEGVEYIRFAQWKFDPAAAPTSAPDLAQSRAAIDGFNTVMVDEIALQWNSLHSPSCPTDLQRAVEAVGASRQLDALYRQALSSATRSYCGLS